jgi:hypothetical protein
MVEDDISELELFFSPSESIDIFLYENIRNKPPIPDCIEMLESWSR